MLMSGTGRLDPATQHHEQCARCLPTGIARRGVSGAHGVRGRASRTAADPTAEAGGRYTTAATVIEAPDHGPQLCTSVMESYPPQCGLGSIEVVGWDWTALDGSEAERGTTWGDYLVIGTYDDQRFTITGTPTPDVAQVVLHVIVDDGLQAELDQRYGPGLCRCTLS